MRTLASARPAGRRSTTRATALPSLPPAPRRTARPARVAAPQDKNCADSALGSPAGTPVRGRPRGSGKVPRRPSGPGGVPRPPRQALSIRGLRFRADDPPSGAALDNSPARSTRDVHLVPRLPGSRDAAPTSGAGTSARSSESDERRPPAILFAALRKVGPPIDEHDASVPTPRGEDGGDGSSPPSDPRALRGRGAASSRGMPPPVLPR
ncbi:hypothetical protein THAOC_00648 [Thalassiosira oceanica]|uniref:Uncharacterized protein n=1 Tax=Thalassiosira oceanica TaxID=159749 RepID=K0TJX0_THAOC|nr:hypothetical protein THAOC_00648 [Thalassiosira oceanica]|eukprot:EJK77519.1 hypothetical protein THAOC_00648 [Thalassiosira oceanica]